MRVGLGIDVHAFASGRRAASARPRAVSCSKGRVDCSATAMPTSSRTRVATRSSAPRDSRTSDITFPTPTSGGAARTASRCSKRLRRWCVEPGWEPVNVDCSVVCEAPKLAPHRAAMCKRLSTADRRGREREGDATRTVSAPSDGRRGSHASRWRSSTVHEAQRPRSPFWRPVAAEGRSNARRGATAGSAATRSRAAKPSASCCWPAGDACASCGSSRTTGRGAARCTIWSSLPRSLRVPVKYVSQAKLDAAARSEAPQGVLARCAPLPEVDLDVARRAGPR